MTVKQDRIFAIINTLSQQDNELKEMMNEIDRLPDDIKNKIKTEIVDNCCAKYYFDNNDETKHTDEEKIEKLKMVINKAIDNNTQKEIDLRSINDKIRNGEIEK